MRVVVINGSRTLTERLTSAFTAVFESIKIVNLDLVHGSGAWNDGANVNEPPLALLIEPEERVEDAFRLLDLVRSLPELSRFLRLLAVGPAALEHVPTLGGFDDFMLAPYTAVELRRRLHTSWTRRRSERFMSGEIYRLAPELTVDAIGHHVLLGDKSIELTAKEHALLVCFCRSLGRVQSRPELIARVWGSGYAGSLRTIDIHVRRLRFKLGQALPLYTIRGSGYWLKMGRLSEPELPETELQAVRANPISETQAASTAA